MFKFFTDSKYWMWSILGTAIIVASMWATVLLDVRINEWFGAFYDDLQKALSKPGSVDESVLFGHMFDFAFFAGIYVIISVIFNGFLVNHWTFRWRKSMAEYYHANWEKSHKIEGASQRVQEDTLKFARITESLGIGILEAIFMIASFLPVLWVLSANITVVPYFGEVERSLVWTVILTALGGTIVLSFVGIKLPGIEYDVQKEEARYRKQLVLGEDDHMEVNASMDVLFDNVRKIHFKAYLHYFYFNTAKWSYLQGMVVVPYIVMIPSITAGLLTLGVLQQVTRAFGKVAESMQYIIRSWTTIVELVSVWKRLREFERNFEKGTK